MFPDWLRVILELPAVKLVLAGKVTVLPPEMDKELELMDKVCTGKATELPLLMEREPAPTLRVGLGTETVNELPDGGVTLARPSPTMFTVLEPVPLSVTVVTAEPWFKLNTLVADE